MKKLFTFFIFFFLSAALFAAERILRYDVTLTLDENAKATVEETITVNAEHKQIRRGIYRTLPQKATQKIKVYSLEMDGRPHPFFTENKNGNLVINFGNDNFIPMGNHTYRLIYTMENAALFHKDIDEVYWNVTGNDWNFTIEQASFHLILPKNADVINEDISLYTGGYGQKGTNAQSTGWLHFETTKPLNSREGFTVAVPFKKGAIKMSYSFLKFLIIPLLLVLAAYIYYFYAWLKVGVDPKDNVPPLYKPPQGISPAMMRYIWLRTADTTSFSSALVSLAMKDKITIDYNKSFLTGNSAEITVKNRDEANIYKDEKFLMDDILFTHFKINKSNATVVQNVVKSFIDEIEKEGKRYVNKNYSYLLPPIIIMIAVLLNVLFLNKEAFFLMIHYTVFATVFPNVFARKVIYKILIFLGFTLFYIPFFATELGSLNTLACYIAYTSIILGFIIFATIIDNVTEEGREVYLQVKGFQKYMSKAEKYRTQASNPLEKEKIFCDYLPYAYALGMQSKWIDAFKDIISESAIEKHLTRCGGMHCISSNMLNRTVNSSMPSKRGGGRGSGGGGFSGGGCGGGGGGGR